MGILKSFIRFFVETLDEESASLARQGKASSVLAVGWHILCHQHLNPLLRPFTTLQLKVTFALVECFFFLDGDFHEVIWSNLCTLSSKWKKIFKVKKSTYGLKNKYAIYNLKNIINSNEYKFTISHVNHSVV